MVHVQTEFGLAHASAAAAERLGIPVVHTVHTFYWASDSPFTAPLTPVMRVALWLATRRSLPRLRLTKRPEDNILRNLTLDMAMRADAVVSPSAHQALDLEAAGVPAPVLVVPNPIATSPRPAVPLSPRPGGASAVPLGGAVRGGEASAGVRAGGGDRAGEDRQRLQRGLRRGRQRAGARCAGWSPGIRSCGCTVRCRTRACWI